MCAGFKRHTVEYEKFGFRAEKCRIADAGRFQIGFGAFGDGARVAVVTLAIGRVNHIASQHKRGIVIKRVDKCGGRVWPQLHIRCLNAFPAANGGTVKSLSVFKPFFGVFQHDTRWNGEVMLLAFGVGETQIDKTDIVVFNHLYNVFDGHGSAPG